MAKLGFWQGNRKEPGAAADSGDLPAVPAPVTSGRNPAPAAPSASRSEAVLLLQNYEESGQGWFWAIDHNGCLTYLTDWVAPLLLRTPESIVGTPFADLFLPGDAEAGAHRTLPFLLMKRSKFEKLSLRANLSGDERWWQLSGAPQFDAAGNFTGYRGNGVDITEQRKSSEHASKLAMYDSLTGLPNRRRMAEILESYLVALDVQKRACAVILIDLDRFKQVNDTLGHPAGDALLKQVSERLLRIVGDRERVFRLGGDEFQIIVRDCDDRGVLGDLANEIIASLSQPYTIAGSRCVIGASIGVAISPFDGQTSDALIRNADLALYAAKEGGRGRFRFFSNELLEAAEDRRVLEEDLRDALAKGEIQLFYQPIVDAKTNITTGVEALVRWHHPERGPISPALFIPIAEETNLIERLGEWALFKACEDAASWPGKLRVAVNVSPIQFAKEGLPAIVMSALAASGLSPERLELEITEGVFLSESSATDAMFETLKDIGVRLALDDFGTGYSSLSYLRTAPFDKIKIDQSFVRAATLPASRNRAIIAAIVALAEALGMETTAEGIESHDQLELIRSLGVSHVQGYIYSKAIAGEDVKTRLEMGAWEIVPVGPARQRAARHSMYRKVGAILGNYYRSVLVRNLSESGALIEGLVDVPLGTLLMIDFGEGQLAFARVRRARKGQYGIEFEQPLVSDGNGGLCTSHRVTPYALSKAGLPSANAPGTLPETDSGNSDALEALRTKLGMSLAPGVMQLIAPPTGGHATDTGAAAGADAPGDADGDGAAGNGLQTTETPVIRQIAERYLELTREDGLQHDIDRDYLTADILPRFGHLRQDELKPSHVADWLAMKIKDEGYPPSKVSRLQSLLGQMYVLAMQWGMPVSAQTLQSLPVFNRETRERCLTPEEVERLNQAVQASLNPQLKFIVTLLMMTGTRQRELLEACWEDVDLDLGLWRIPAPEPGRSRTVTLIPGAIAILRELPRFDDCPHVIVNPVTRKPYRSFHASWDSARKKAGLADVEIDDLRHTPYVDPAPQHRPVETVKTVLRRTVGHV